MAIEKPGRGSGRKEPLGLDSAATHLLEECRMVLPGIQAVFGFQLIAVFNEAFADKLSRGEQILHLTAISLVVLAIALIMAPAAIHRRTQQREVSERFIWISSQLVLASMFPLALALCLDIYLIGRIILDSASASLALAGSLLVIFLVSWIVLPLREGRMHR
jgi:hypothetical protein